jgi:hypothetical protein
MFFMPGFRVQIMNLPEQTGERRISIHWFFLPLGLVLVAVGAWELLAFVMCEKRIREGRPPKTLFTIRARQLILFGFLGGYMALFIVVFELLPSKIAWVWPPAWVLGGGLLGNGIVNYFRRHPPKH